MLWFWSALSAAALWGVSYNAGAHVLKSGIAPSVHLAFGSLIILPFCAAMALSGGGWDKSLALLRGNPKLLLWMLASALFLNVGNLLVYVALRYKSATAVSFIEISYPIFVALFAWLIFREAELTRGIIFGGALIFSGIAVMYFVK